MNGDDDGWVGRKRKVGLTTEENAGAACTDLMVAGQAVPFSFVGFMGAPQIPETSMRRIALVAMMIVLASTCVLAQPRRGGVSRDPQAEGGNSSGGSRPSRSGESRPAETQPPAPPPATIIETHPSPPPPREPFPGLPPPLPDQGHCYVGRPVPVLIVERVIVEEEPEVLQAVLRNGNVAPGKSCIDFSAQDVTGTDCKAFDVRFSVSDEVPEFLVGLDADIQNLGSRVAFEEIESAPSGNWSATHGVVAEPENVYVAWTWDNQYYKFVVTSLAEERVAIQWEKLHQGMRIASNEDCRNGTDRVEVNRFGW